MGHSCKLKALGAFGKLRSAKIDPHSREPLSDAAYCSYFESSQNFHLWKTSLPSEGKSVTLTDCDIKSLNDLEV